MNSNEKKVIRWKRHLVASNVTWSDEFVRALKLRHLLSDGALLQIEPESNSFSRMIRYIELLSKDVAWFGAGSNGDFVRTPFQALCDVIENEGGQPWVAEELRTELKTEKGDLMIEDYVHKEASQLVHRLYGGNKRLSESEKRRLESLIAIRTQCTKDVWKSNLESTQMRLDEYRQAVRSNIVDVVTAAKTVQDVVRDQRKALDGGTNNSGSKVFFSAAENPVGHRAGRDAVLPTLPDIHGKSNGRVGSGQSSIDEMTGRDSTSGFSLNRITDEQDSRHRPAYSHAWSGDDQINGRQQQQQQLQRIDGHSGFQTVVGILSEAADQIRRMTDAWSTERDRLRAERSRALVALGIRDSSANSPSSVTGSAPRIDIELHATLQRLNAELSCAKDRAVDAEERAARLEDRLRSMRSEIEDDLRSKDRTISLLTSSLERAEKEAEASNGESRELKRQLQILKSELSRYSVKSRYLEKNRHLGYVRDTPESIDAPGYSRGWTAANSPAVTRSLTDGNSKINKPHINGLGKSVWRGSNGSS